MRKWGHFNYLSSVYVKPFLKRILVGIGQRISVQLTYLLVSDVSYH